MNEDSKTLIKYRLQRSWESLKEAELLYKEGYYNTYVNRLYYACFYGVTAWLLSEGLSSSKHTGVRSLFHRQLVKTGVISAEFGKHYDRLFDNRLKGDYSDLVRFTKEDVQNWFDETKKFVEVIEEILEKKLEGDN